MAHQMGGADKVKRQHDAGRLTVRERIDKLVDGGSFMKWARCRALASTTPTVR